MVPPAIYLAQFSKLIKHSPGVKVKKEMVLASYTGSANNWPSKGRMFGEKKRRLRLELK